MSLTSYRAAPPRVGPPGLGAANGVFGLLARRPRGGPGPPSGSSGRGAAGDFGAAPRAAAWGGIIVKRALSIAFGRPGGDLLSQVLRHSTIGAEAFDGRVRDGIGSGHLAESHQAGEAQSSGKHMRASRASSGFGPGRRDGRKLVF